MDAADLRDFVSFEEDEVVRRTVFESSGLWSQVLCLQGNRRYGPVTDPTSDAVLTVVAGEAVFMVDRGRKRMKQWGSVLVPAGARLAVASASPEPLVILMTVAPPPSSRPLSG